MDNNRNLFLTIALSVMVLLGWQVLYINPKIEAERKAQIEREAIASGDTVATDVVPTPDAGIPQSTVQPETVMPALDRESALAQGNAGRIAIDTPALTGSINLAGARVDDLSLKKYRTKVDPTSPIVQLLSPSGLPDTYFAEFGFTGVADAPSATQIWTAPEGAVLTPSTPVVLTYSSASGLTFERTISIDADYMFTYDDKVTNTGGDAVALQNYGRVTRFSKPQVASTYILHQGLIGVTGEEGLQELTFDKIVEKVRVSPGKSSDGWLGITDKYWAATVVPKTGVEFEPRFSYIAEGTPRWQSDFLTDAVIINAGETKSFQNLLFAGAKESHRIDAYETEREIRQFELLIDWGWLYFITKPMFVVLDWLFRVFGNFGIAILITTVAVKAIFFPLANKSYTSMARMKVVQPKMEEIKKKYGDDREKLQKAMMDLYRTEKINPVAGCWPVLIQIPVFFALYKVLFVTIEMRHAPFFGWIQDLSAPDPTTIFNLFGLLPYDPTLVPIIGGLLGLGVWPIIMGITMFIQMQMNPTPPDPTQQMIFRWMPVVFTFMLAAFPAGLVIYWAWNNFLSIIQQGAIMKKNGAEIALWDNLSSMFKSKDKK